MPRGDTATEEHTSQTHMHCAHVCPFATATAIQTFRSEINHFPYSKLLSKQRVQRSSTTSTTIHLRKFMRVQCQRYTESISLKILLVKFTNRANYVYLLNYGKFDTRYIYICLCTVSARIEWANSTIAVLNEEYRTKHEHFEHVPNMFDARRERKVIQPQPLLLWKSFQSSQRNAFGQCHVADEEVQMNLWIWWQRGWSDLKCACVCVCMCLLEPRISLWCKC